MAFQGTTDATRRCYCSARQIRTSGKKTSWAENGYVGGWTTKSSCDFSRCLAFTFRWYELSSDVKIIECFLGTTINSFRQAKALWCIDVAFIFRRGNIFRKNRTKSYRILYKIKHLVLCGIFCGGLRSHLLSQIEVTKPIRIPIHKDGVFLDCRLHSMTRRFYSKLLDRVAYQDSHVTFWRGYVDWRAGVWIVCSRRIGDERKRLSQLCTFQDFWFRCFYSISW